MLDVLASSRTTKTMWLAWPAFAPSSRTTFAKYIPDVALAGTLHEAETAQFPQSMSPVAESLRQAGWD